MKFDHITHLVLLGAFSGFAAIVGAAREAGLEVDVITSPDQAGEIDTKLNALVASSVADSCVAAALDRKSSPEKRLAISFGARWIMTQETRRGLFADQILNAHGTRLPQDRGGAGFSWRIMRGDRLGATMLHLMDDGVDTGPVLAAKEYVLPRSCSTPAEAITDYQRRLLPFILQFLDRAMAGEDFAPAYQPKYGGTYLPRLHTPTNGWVDWRMSGQDLDRFILAFDAPYAGALTRWRSSVVHLKSCQLTAGDTKWHPWQAGLVHRNAGAFLSVCTASGESLIIESLVDANGVSLLPAVTEGDRLFTPIEDLERALSTRGVVGPRGHGVTESA